MLPQDSSQQRIQLSRRLAAKGQTLDDEAREGLAIEATSPSKAVGFVRARGKPLAEKHDVVVAPASVVPVVETNAGGAPDWAANERASDVTSG